MMVVRPIIDTTTLGSREGMQAKLSLRPEGCQGDGSRRVGGASQPYPGFGPADLSVPTVVVRCVVSSCGQYTPWTSFMPRE